MREAPSLALIGLLLKAGAKIRVYDPVAMDECRRRVGGAVEYAGDQYQALDGADALVVVTEWNEFRVPNFGLMAKLMKSRVIFDGRNIYEPAEMKELEFTHYGIGRGKAGSQQPEVSS